MNRHDKSQLRKLKAEIVDNCDRCSGLDLKCNCYKKFWNEVHKVTAGIPLKYRNFTFDDLKAPFLKKPREVIKKYVTNLNEKFDKGIGLYLWGDIGTAKTGFLCAILNKAIEKGYSVKFINSLNSVVQKHISNDLQDLIEIPFLGLDDLGKEMHSTSTKQQELLGVALDILIRERTNRLLPTLVTSNLNYDDLEVSFGRFGIGVISLMKEHLHNVKFKGVDYRSEVINHQRKKEEK